MITLRYDMQTGQLVDEYGARYLLDVRIAYQEAPTWTVIFGVADPVAGTFTPADVSVATAWAAAIDDDFDDASTPMVRTLDEGIDDTDAATGVIVVSLDADTATFATAVGTSPFLRTTNFELRGLDAGSALAVYAQFPVVCGNTMDPSGGDPPDPAGNYYTKTESDARYAKLVGDDDIEITDAAKGLVLRNSNGERRRITIDNYGNINVSDPL